MCFIFTIFRYSCTAFAYGQTGSGKTHTITGPLVTKTIWFLKFAGMLSFAVLPSLSFHLYCNIFTPFLVNSLALKEK